jgi:hypothetical protein
MHEALGLNIIRKKTNLGHQPPPRDNLKINPPILPLIPLQPPQQALQVIRPRVVVPIKLLVAPRQVGPDVVRVVVVPPQARVVGPVGSVVVVGEAGEFLKKEEMGGRT